MYKKIAASALIIASSLVIGTAAMAEPTPPVIGIVDMQRVMVESTFYKEFKTAEDDMKKLEKQLQDDMMNKDKQLEDARKKGVSQTELMKLREKFEKEIYEQRTKAQNLVKTKQSQLEDGREKLKKEVDKAIKDIAGEKKIDVIFDKQAVLFGGMDITDDVSKKLLKK